jgi:hypothetical protein
MNRSARTVLRKLGTDQHLDAERQQHIDSAVDEAQERLAARSGGTGQDGSALDAVPDELLSESEKRHEKYRRQQAVAGRFPPAAERLPIMTAEQRRERDKSRPKWSQTQFEGPIEKLIEKYGALEEVKRHLTLGQSMKYEFTQDGQVLDNDGNLIYDGTELVKRG